MRAVFQARHPKRSETRGAEGSQHFASVAATLCMALALGCRTSPAPVISTPTAQNAAIRPVTPPATFKLFHQTKDSLTLVVPESSTDDKIASLIYSLHLAARSNTFNDLGLPQKFIDARDPIVWFHIYRGEKCASEKYSNGKYPCGPSYHAAGDYTLGSFSNRNRDEGVLLKDETHTTQLWDPDAKTESSFATH